MRHRLRLPLHHETSRICHPPTPTLPHKGGGSECAIASDYLYIMKLRVYAAPHPNPPPQGGRGLISPLKRRYCNTPRQ